MNIPTFEDKVLQRAIAMLIEPICETDFLDASFFDGIEPLEIGALPEKKSSVEVHGFPMGGLVFAPFTTDLLNSLGDGFYWAIPFLSERWSFVSGERDEQVVLTRVLAGGLNEGYHDEFFQKIETVNGELVKNLRHMIELIEAGEGDDFIVFESSKGRKIVLDRNAVKKSGARILKAYQVTNDRSEDLKKRFGVPPLGG